MNKPILLFIFAVVSLAPEALGALQNESIKVSEWRCEFTGEDASCKSDSPNYPNQLIFENKISKLARKTMSEYRDLRMPCLGKVTNIDSVFDVSSESALAANISATYLCFEGESSSEAHRKLKTEAYEHLSINCSQGVISDYRSGFDYGEAGSRMHWDTQGTSAPAPYVKVEDTQLGSVSRKIYEAICSS
jgi:hypothetical protein